MEKAIQELISSIGCGRAVVLFGAGPSSEIHLVNWHDLASKIARSVSITLRDSIDGIWKLISSNKYPEAFDTMENLLNSRGHNGREILIDHIKTLLTDNGTTGDIYTLLAKLPVNQYITTNYDSVFERHLQSMDMAPESFTNTRESVQDLNPSSYEKSILHLHGSNTYGGHFVITSSDYSHFLTKPEFQAIRKYLESHLCCSPIVILGYSFTDPDLIAVARSVAGIFQRKYPVIALIADANYELTAQFAQDYNVRVISYSSADGHKQLKSILSVVDNWLKSQQVSAVASKQDMKAAQTLFVYDATKAADKPLVIAAVKSLIIVAVYEGKGTITKASIASSLVEVAGAKPDRVLLEQALEECIGEGLVTWVDAVLNLTEDATDMLESAKRKYRRLWTNLNSHMNSTLELLSNANGVLENVLIGIFSERAAEAVGLAFCDSPIETCSSSLFNLISSHTRSMENVNDRICVINYIIDLIRKPNRQQRAIILHLARSLFCTHALKLDKDAHAAFSNFALNRALIIDSNVLIPLLAVDCPSHDSISTLISTAASNNVKLFTTNSFVTEAMNHAHWAVRFVRENGESEDTLLAGASGGGIWQGNEFLSGMIIRSNRSGIRVDIREYVGSCIGGLHPSHEEFSSFLSDTYEIEVIDVQKYFDINVEASSIFTDTKVYVNSDLPSNKSDVRVQAESEAYTLVYQWNLLNIDSSTSISTILSHGSYFNRLCSNSQHKIPHNIVITPYSFAAFVDTYLNSSANQNFDSIVKSQFFNTASDFLEDTELQRYFSTLISAADKVYEEILRPRMQALNIELIPDDLPDTLADILPTQRPQTIRALSKYLATYSSIEEVKKLRRDLEQSEIEKEQEKLKASAIEELLQKRRRGQKMHDRMYAKGKRKRK